MKTIFLVPFLLVAAAWADETADRASIARAVTALNDPGQRAGAFAKSANPVTEILRLVNAFPPVAHPPLGQLEPPSSDARLTVVISHEPWGEATIVPVPSGIAPAVPRIESGPIQFLNPDVALVEGTARPADRIVPMPVLFVMLREGPDWKIGSLRVLKPRTDETHPLK
ncbi:MAG: hypothetical protein ABSB88_11035 [Bryobacteraceae bacterium]|jgi:hypothetical protein